MSRVIINKSRPAAGEEVDLRTEIEALPPKERKAVLGHYAKHLDADAVAARGRGRFEQANFLAELAHQLRCGQVTMPGEIPGLEYLLEMERRYEEETLNTYERPSMPFIFNTK